MLNYELKPTNNTKHISKKKCDNKIRIGTRARPNHLLPRGLRHSSLARLPTPVSISNILHASRIRRPTCKQLFRLRYPTCNICFDFNIWHLFQIRHPTCKTPVSKSIHLFRHATPVSTSTSETCFEFDILHAASISTSTTPVSISTSNICA